MEKENLNSNVAPIRSPELERKIGNAANQQIDENKRFLGRTKNGISVFVTPESHLASHTDVTEELVAEGLAKIEYTAPFMMTGVDFDRVIGKDTCVKVTEEDDVRMMYRKNHTGKTPIVFGREPDDSNHLNIGICDDGGDAVLFTAFVGKSAPKEPWDKNIRSEEERLEAEEFWSKHALCYNENDIDFEKSDE